MVPLKLSNLFLLEGQAVWKHGPPVRHGVTLGGAQRSTCDVPVFGTPLYLLCIAVVLTCSRLASLISLMAEVTRNQEGRSSIAGLNLGFILDTF